MSAEVTEATATRPAEIRQLRQPAPVERSVDRCSTEGTVLGRVSLDASLFGIEPNQAVLHQVVTAQLAAARAGTQSTKTRAEVRGGGAKPYRQKGTGRARQGSTRAPQWVGGGVALGPKPRSYAQRTPKRMIQLALRSALSDRAGQDRVALIDAWSFEVPSTKRAIAALEALGVSGRVLVVLGDEDGYAERSFANLPEVQTLLAGELNAYDILVNDWIVFTDKTLPGEAVDIATPEPETGAGQDEVVGEDVGSKADGHGDVETDDVETDDVENESAESGDVESRADEDGGAVAEPADEDAASAEGEVTEEGAGS